PSVGVFGNIPFKHMAVVPELNLIVHGINIDNASWTQAWAANLAGQVQQGDQLQSEASISDDRLFLTSSTSLICLDFVTGQAKWAPVPLNSSPVQAPAAASNGNIYLVVGTSVEAFSGATGAMISATTPTNTQGLLIFRPSIAKDGSVLVGDTQSILEFR